MPPLVVTGTEITRRQFFAVVAAAAGSLGANAVAGPAAFTSGRVIPAVDAFNIHRRLTTLEARIAS